MIYPFTYIMAGRDLINSGHANKYNYDIAGREGKYDSNMAMIYVIWVPTSQFGQQMVMEAPQTYIISIRDLVTIVHG
jgi:hypothetical protein